MWSEHDFFFQISSRPHYVQSMVKHSILIQSALLCYATLLSIHECEFYKMLVHQAPLGIISKLLNHQSKPEHNKPLLFFVALREDHSPS